jgi:hypothetical protein
MIYELGQEVDSRRGSSFRIQIKLMWVYYHDSKKKG